MITENQAEFEHMFPTLKLAKIDSEYIDYVTARLWEVWNARQPQVDRLRGALLQANIDIIRKEKKIFRLKVLLNVAY